MDPDDFGHRPRVPGLDRGPDAVPKPPRKVGHTCPAIDRAKSKLRDLSKLEERNLTVQGFSLLAQIGFELEQLRADNAALRERAGWAEREVKRLKGGF